MKPKIMFVDDNVGVLESLKWVFKDEPYEVFAFNNPAAALQASEKMDFAVVIADQLMPDMFGTELLQKIKARSPMTVGMIMSAFVEVKMSLEAIDRGMADQFIKKPWTPQGLRAAVKKAVAQYLKAVEKKRQEILC